MAVKRFKKIVVTTDFSDLSFAALEYAAAVHDLLDVQVYLLYVGEKQRPKKIPAKQQKKELSKPISEATILQQLTAVTDKLLSDCGTVKKVIRHGDPSKEIVQYAQDEKMDLIIISTHGRTGLSHVLLGSVAERVVRHSLVPVLTVKPLTIQNQIMEEEDIDEQLHLRSNDTL
jgi:universal stress protein A